MSYPCYICSFTLQAWIRMAINDGVLESYFDAMLVEPKLIRHFYQKTAYLRDPEHPGIFKTYIQGKNSRVRNVDILFIEKVLNLVRINYHKLLILFIPLNRTSELPVSTVIQFFNVELIYYDTSGVGWPKRSAAHSTVINDSNENG